MSAVAATAAAATAAVAATAFLFPEPHTASHFLDAPADVFFAGFEPYFNFDTFRVYRRQVPSSGLYEYKVRGTFPTTPHRNLLAVYLDVEYRTKWDPHVLEGKRLAPSTSPTTAVGVQPPEDGPPDSRATSPSADSGVEVASTNGNALVDSRLSELRRLHAIPQFYHYAIKVPFPLVTRDYVYTLRAWHEDDGNDHLVEGRSTVHADKPETKQAIRIDHYYQQIAIRALPDGRGSAVGMRYYDDPKGSIPTVVINMAAKKGVPDFVKGLTNACKGYDEWLKNRKD
ncbi:hypothetical protein DFJ73DRAFT_859002 [Zopfochytrium polystomum]|nr:hypothetical protein DFJ73DRAFT_859002 [Zopfochytrium polystomum]